MKRSTYRDRDYPFGQTMLTLRSAMGLSQAGLADFLGISRRAVGEWEAGSKYPRVEHLKQFITLAVQQQVFPTGRESESIRALWSAARQKVLLDETWLAALLELPPNEDDAGEIQTAVQSASPRLEWGDALTVPAYYGREWELSLLTEWVVEEHCRAVSILGLGGIGKSALAVTLMHRVADHFDYVIWRSLRDTPTCEAFFADLLQILAPRALTEESTAVEQYLKMLMEQMRQSRVLLVLDNLESILTEGEGSGQMLPEYEALERFLQQTAASDHQSCVLLTSREKPSVLIALEGNQSPVRALRLARLDAQACEALLAEKGVTGTMEERVRLIESYTGNPLALKIVAQTIVDLFDGDPALFLEQGEVIFGGVRDLLSQQFARLSALEQSILLWLAILRESIYPG